MALITNLQQIRDRERSRRARRMVAGLSLASESELLRAAVRQRKNVPVAGREGAGNTTLVNAVSEYVVWAKPEAMRDGAEIASKRLWAKQRS